MEEFEIRPQEIPEAGEGIESTEQQALDVATFEPGAFVKQMGGYQQAETIQQDFTALVESAPALPEPPGVGSTDDVITAAMNRQSQEGGNNQEAYANILAGLETLEEQLQAAQAQKQDEKLEAQKDAD